jgi:hypothetical protein
MILVQSMSAAKSDLAGESVADYFEAISGSNAPAQTILPRQVKARVFCINGLT